MSLGLAFPGTEPLGRASSCPARERPLEHVFQPGRGPLEGLLQHGEVSGNILGPSWRPAGSGGPLEPSHAYLGGVFEPSWAVWGNSWVSLGLLWGPRETPGPCHAEKPGKPKPRNTVFLLNGVILSWRLLGPLRGPLVRVSGPVRSWKPLGLSWRPAMALWRRLATTCSRKPFEEGPKLAHPPGQTRGRTPIRADRPPRGGGGGTRHPRVVNKSRREAFGSFRFPGALNGPGDRQNTIQDETLLLGKKSRLLGANAVKNTTSEVWGSLTCRCPGPEDCRKI